MPNHLLLKVRVGILLVLTAGLALVMYPFSSEIFEHNKFVLLYLFCAALMLTYSLQNQKSDRIILQFDLLVGVVFLRFLSILPSVFLAPYQWHAVHGVLGRLNGGLVSEGMWLFLFVVLRAVFRSDPTGQIMRKIKYTSLISSVLVVIIGSFAYFGFDLVCFFLLADGRARCWGAAFDPSARMFSTLGQPNWLGIYLVINGFLLVPTILTANSKFKSFIASLSFIFLSFGIYATHSRSAYLAFLVGIIFLVVDVLTKNFKKFWHFQILCLSGFFVILTFVITTMISQAAIIPARQSPDNPSSSYLIRSLVYKSAWQMWQDNPLFGVGRENFGLFYAKYKTPSANYTSEWDYLYNKVHNEYLSELVSSGILAFILIVSVVFIGLYQIVKLQKEKIPSKSEFLDLASFKAIFLAIIISNTFGFATSNISFWWVVILAFISAKGNNIFTRDFSISGRIFWRILPLVTAIVIVIYTGRFWLADYWQNNQQSQEITKQYRSLVRSQALFPHPDYQLSLNSFILTNIATVAQKDDASLPYEKYLSTSLVNLQHQYSVSPSISRQIALQYLLLAQLSKKNIYFSRAIQIAQKLINNHPNEPRFAYLLALIMDQVAQQAITQSSKTDLLDQALVASEYAYQLKNNWTQNIRLQIDILKELNFSSEALAKIRQLRQMAPDDLDLQAEENTLIQSSNDRINRLK